MKELTERQKGILAFRAWGLSLKVTAHECGISVKTVQRHIEMVRRKLGIGPMEHLVHYAIAAGLVPVRPILLMVALILTTGATELRSPKDAANQPKRLRTATAPVTLDTSWMMPPTPTPSFVIIRPKKPYHITLAWDALPGIASNKIYSATNNMPGGPGEPYYRAGLYTNTWGTVSNLWPGTGYQFNVTSVSNELESDFSMPLYWPRPRTNWITFGVSVSPTNLSWFQTMAVTNPAGIGFWRLERLSNSYSFQMAPALKGPWIVLSNWPAINPTTNFYLRWMSADNVSGMQHPD